MGCAGSSPSKEVEAAKGASTRGLPASPALKVPSARYAVPDTANGTSDAPKPSEASTCDAMASMRALNKEDASSVQTTLLKVSTLIQKFAEGRNERTTPVQALRKALDLVVLDCKAKVASVHCVSEAKDAGLLVALVGAPDTYLEKNRLQKLDSDDLAFKIMLDNEKDFLGWRVGDPNAVTPTDWNQLAETSGLQYLSAVPIRACDRVIGLLTLGFEEYTGQQEQEIWPTYMQLISSSLSSMIKDNSIPKYMNLAREIHDAPDIDTLMHHIMTRIRIVLGHTNNQHMWYRVALTASSNAAATIFDDLTQVSGASVRSQNSSSNLSSSGSFRLLKEVQAAGGIMRTVVAMKSTVMKISIHNRQQVMIPDVQKLMNQSGNVSTDIFNTRLVKPPTSVLVFPLKVKQVIFGVLFCMSTVHSDFSDVSPRLREVCEVMSPHLLLTLTHQLKEDYQAVQQATPNTNDSLNMSFSRDMNGGSGINIGGASASDVFAFAQSRSSTGALVTGLTEKLNQKRIKSSMEFDGSSALLDLQVNHLLGEGGFAKVFRGLWRGLVVGIKVVCDDGKNEKMVMKNAHEIAILSAISHPNIVQAYTCMTDILVHDLCQASFRSASPQVLSSPAYKYLLSMEDRPCHIEVIEYCDLGNLSTALKNQVFMSVNTEKLLTVLANAASQGLSDVGRGDNGESGRMNMRSLLLTLIEIASAMGDLHRMGVVHCDLKPANVLLKSSNNDPRGFTVKVSDFGLSRVEDDETAASFPFNSCGTAAYVAPEALICNKKVNSSVDVYAYGILMWEAYTALRPYGNMQQQQLVEEVVMKGFRPKFPSSTPQDYVNLAHACWNGSPQARPTFEEALSCLNEMLQGLGESGYGDNSATNRVPNNNLRPRVVSSPRNSPNANRADMQGGSVSPNSRTPK